MLAVVTLMMLASCNRSETSEEDLGGETASETYPPLDVEGLAVFGNDAYQCRVIRPELADSTDSDMYADIRKTLKSVTGKTCPIETDFVGAGGSLDLESPAILVGETEYPESKQVYETLKHGEYRMELIGNKFVIAYTNDDAAALALKKFRGLASVSKQNGVLAITEKWNNSEKLSSAVDGLPVFEGSAVKEFDAGDKSTLLVYKHVEKSAHDAFVAGMETCGYELYTTNEIGVNSFLTYHNEDSIVNIMYLPNLEQTRVVIDTKEFSSLAGLESDNVYEPGQSEMSFTQLGLEHPKAGDCQNGMAYIIKLSDGSFIIIDGGHTGDMSYADSAGDYLVDSLKVLADDPDDIRVNTWFISHLHHDHMGALYDIAREMPDSLTIDRMIYNAPNEAQLSGVGSENLDNELERVAEIMNVETIVKGHPGQVFHIREAKFTIFGGLDLVEPIKIDNVNDTCMVMQMEFMGKTMMFLGDCHPFESRALTDIYGDALKSDLIQLSHHGYGGSATLLLNQLIDAEASFWPVGSSDYKNNVSKPANVPANQAFVDIPHYVAGRDNLTVTDFDTWIPDEKRWTPYD